jgi:hypothetical protein
MTYGPCLLQYLEIKIQHMCFSKKIFLLICMVLFFSSCQRIINHYEVNKVEQFILPGVEKEQFCPISKTKEVFFGENEESLKIVPSLISKDFTTYDKFILWALVQMVYRPDAATPNSRLQFMFKQKNKNIIYKDFKAPFKISKLKVKTKEKTANKKKKKKVAKQKDFMPFLYGLHYISKNFPTRYSLKQLIKIVDKHLPSHILAAQELANYVSTNASALAGNKYFFKTFFKGTQPVRKDESIRRPKFTPLISYFYKDLKRQAKKIAVNNYLFNFRPHNFTHVGPQEPFKLSCNQDLLLYEHSIYLITPNLQHRTISFGLKSKNGDQLLGVISNIPSHAPLLKRNSFIKGESITPPASLCFYDNGSGVELLLSSTKERDPGQFVYQLFKERLLNGVKSVEELKSAINLPRTLFLPNPPRVLFESERKNTQKKLESLLGGDYPVYHTPLLGHLTAMIKLDTEFNIIVDDRQSSFLQCQ